MRFTPTNIKLDTDITGNIPWIAEYISVNNPGNRWIYLPQIKKWIPPTYMNAIFPWGITPPSYEICIGSAVASDGQSGTPSGVTAGTGASALPTIEFISQEPVTPNPGTPYGITINAGTVNLAAGTSVSISGTPNVQFTNAQIAVLNVTGGILQVASNQTQILTIPGGPSVPGTFDLTASVPAGTQSLIVIITRAITISFIKGVQSGSQIFNQVAVSQGIYVVPWTSTDTQVEIAGNIPGGSAPYGYVIASPVALGTVIYNKAEQPVITQEFANKDIVVYSAVNANSTLSVLAGVSDRSIRLKSLNMDINQAIVAYLQDSLGNNLGLVSNNMRNIDFKSYQLGLGVGLQLFNPSTTLVTTFQGTLIVDQR